MKPSSIGPPNTYLRGKVSRVELPNGAIAYALSMSQYIQAVVKNIEKSLKDKGKTLTRNSKTPLQHNYSPELEKSKELSEEDANQYQSIRYFKMDIGNG